MVDVPPRWAFIIYAKLWVSFKDKTFSREDVNGTIEDNSTNISQVFSILKKCGWLSITLDPQDSRKSLYTLKNLKELIEEIGGMT